jgi:DNA topoisomerase-1
MSRHTVNIDRDQARLYDLIWKRTLASQMSDAKLTNKRKIEANNHGEIFTASGEVLLLKVSKVYLKVMMMTMKRAEGMLPAMKVNEKLQNNYITATERYSRAPGVIQTSLVKKLEELELVVRQLMPTISTIIRNYVEKGNLDGQGKYTQLVLQSETREVKENTGSDKGKCSTDIGTIVTDFLVKISEIS